MLEEGSNEEIISGVLFSSEKKTTFLTLCLYSEQFISQSEHLQDMLLGMLNITRET